MSKADRWDWCVLAVGVAWLVGPEIINRIRGKILVAETEAALRQWTEAEEP